MESERTRIYIVHGGYDTGFNFETTGWITEEPNTFLYFRKDMRVANTLFSSVLFKYRKAVIKLFKKEVDLCGCHLGYIEHRLVMDTGWEYPEDTGKLVFICPYRKLEIPFTAQMDVGECNEAIKRLKREMGSDIVVPNAKLAAACREALNDLIRDSHHESATMEWYDAPFPYPLPPLSDSPLEDFDLVAELSKRANDIPAQSVMQEDTKGTKSSAGGREEGEVTFKSVSSVGEMRPYVVAIRDNRSAQPIGFLIRPTDTSTAEAGVSGGRFTGLGNSQAAPIELFTDSDDEMGASAAERVAEDSENDRDESAAEEEHVECAEDDMEDDYASDMRSGVSGTEE